MTEKTSLGDRMKAYEGIQRTMLIPNMPVLARLDGRAFHTLTRGMKKPFDSFFQTAMLKTAEALCEEIQGCRIAYVQSDEITLLIYAVATKEKRSEAWFGLNLQKMCSVAAGIASVACSRFLCRPYAVFDARFWNVPLHEVTNNFIWRQQDATRNSIQGLAQKHFSPNQLHGKSCDELQEMLFSEHGINWNDCQIIDKRGACVRREDGEWSIDREIPIFTQDRDYIEKLLILEGM